MEDSHGIFNSIGVAFSYSPGDYIWTYVDEPHPFSIVGTDQQFLRYAPGSIVKMRVRFIEVTISEVGIKSKVSATDESGTVHYDIPADRIFLEQSTATEDRNSILMREEYSWLRR